jgi:hypothetical protein
MVDDVFLRIDHHVIPTDFIILDMSEDEKLSIILERPFLSTIGTTISCVEGKIVLKIYAKEIVQFFAKKNDQMEKKIPQAKRVNLVSVNDTHPKVCLPSCEIINNKNTS